MQNIDLNLFLKNYGGNISYVVCSSDELNFALKINEFVIANTDPVSLPGRHWVAFYKNHNNILQFFDSFGCLPEYYSRNFVLFLKENSVKKYYETNSCKIQNSNSNICGLYCLLFYVSVTKNIGYDYFLSQFSNNTIVNDLYCLNSIEVLFHYKFDLK